MSSASNVDLTESKQDSLRMLLMAMAVVPTVVILIRAWSRALLPTSPTSKIPTKFWWDDWTAFAGAALNIAVCGMGLKLIELGLGLHIQAVPPENIEPFLKLLWIIYYIFDTGTAVGKSSALFFYARIFTLSNSWFKYALWLVHIANAIWLIIILLSVTFMCNPIEKAWKPTEDGHCLNTGRFWMGSGITSLLIDIVILILPMPMLWRLKTNLARKLQICGVFVCGYLVVVVSIGRLVTIIEAGDELEQDPTYKIATPVLWLGSEIAISIISVSLPSLFFLAQRAHREGFYSLFSTRTLRSRSRLTSSHNRFHEGDDHGLVSESSTSLNDLPEGRSKRSKLYPTHTRTTAEFGGSTDAERSKGSGIHVLRDVTVA